MHRGSRYVPRSNTSINSTLLESMLLATAVRGCGADPADSPSSFAASEAVVTDIIVVEAVAGMGDVGDGCVGTSRTLLGFSVRLSAKLVENPAVLPLAGRIIVSRIGSTWVLIHLDERFGSCFAGQCAPSSHKRVFCVSVIAH
jgi:hypothetical protein